MLDEIIIVFRNSKIQLKIFSNLYDLFEILIGSKSIIQKVEKINNKIDVEATIDETPLNVFHLNANKNKENLSEVNKPVKKSRVEIIRPKKVSSENQPQDPLTHDFSDLGKFSKKDSKIFLKRLEYYFKWFNMNKINLLNLNNVEKITSELSSLKQIISIDSEQFENEKEFIDKNLKIIRKSQLNANKQNLIEEI